MIVYNINRFYTYISGLPHATPYLHLSVVRCVKFSVYVYVDVAGSLVGPSGALCIPSFQLYFRRICPNRPRVLAFAFEHAIIYSQAIYTENARLPMVSYHQYEHSRYSKAELLWRIFKEGWLPFTPFLLHHPTIALFLLYLCLLLTFSPSPSSLSP